ncbi:hypothetical protein C8J56DRAFT_1051221 [Mycena floridula]|nr:hypothetical protein C8J56DRAFT_1051221 [Mycena floridula]
MMQTSKAECEAQASGYAEVFWAASIALEPYPSDGEESDEDISEILELQALHWTHTTMILAGNALRGPYNQVSRSEDFFKVALQAPDREFRHMFRVGREMFDRLVAMIAPNPVFHHLNAKKPQRHVTAFSEKVVQRCFFDEIK